MSAQLAAITIPWSPTYHLGPLELSWHGTMIAAGIALAGVVAGRLLRARGFDTDELWTMVGVVGLVGVIGSRVLFIAQNEPAAFGEPGRWLGTHGYSIYGAVIGGAIAALVYVHRRKLDWAYVGAIAVGFPIGDALGRVGDVISGEHFGPATSVPWGVRYTAQGAEVPQLGVTYHSGALYEIVAVLLIFPIMLWIWSRFRDPLIAFWSVLALYGLGRFVIFFWRLDSASGPAGLSEAQWISLGLVLVGVIGAVTTGRRHRSLSSDGSRPAPA